MSDIPVSQKAESQSALSREWLVARVVLIGGFVVAVAAIVYFGWVQPTNLRREALAKAQQQARQNVEDATQLCLSGLKSAQSFGIVPPYGRLFGHSVYRTSVQGRYVCVAATHATKYLVAVELLCRNVKDRNCVSLFSVTQADGKTLYQRQS